MGGRTITIALTETNDIENNRSTIGYVITIRNDVGYYKYNNGNRMLFKLGSQTLIDTANVCAIQLSNVGQVVTLASGAWVYNHNSDGSGSFGVYLFFQQTQNTANTATIDNTHTCTTIPRATTPQLPASAPIGTAITINLPRANSAWVHDITYDYGALTGQTAGLSPATGAGTSCTFTPPNILHGQIVAMASRPCTITVTTRQGSNVIGTRTATITLTASARPVISEVQLMEAGNVPTSWGVWVKGVSRLRVQVSASAQYASAVTAVIVSFGGKIYTGADITTDPVNNTGTLVVTVTDDRGLEQTHAQTITVTDYQTPRIKRFSVHRCDEQGMINGTGTYGSALIEYECTQIGLNAGRWAIKYAVQGGNLIQTMAGTGLEKFGSEITGSIFGIDRIYDVVLEITDSIGSSTAMITLPSADCMAEFRGDGRGVSIGGYSQGAGLEIYYDRAVIDGAQIITDVCAETITVNHEGTDWTCQVINLGKMAMVSAAAGFNDLPVTAWGSIFASGGRGGFKWPVQFESAPQVYVSMRSNNGNCWPMINVQQTVTNAPQVQALRATNSNVSPRIYIMAIGRLRAEEAPVNTIGSAIVGEAMVS